MLLAILIIAAGCRSGSDAKRSQALAWQKIPLPAGVRPTTFGTDQRQMIIGGRLDTGPWLAMVGTSDAITPVTLRKHSPYAFTAEFVSIGIWDGHIAALGNVHGGAHGNSRWTVWTGDTGSITEYPQNLDTFGGVNGGDLAAIVINKTGPLITGSYRFGDSGLDGGIWFPDGTPVGRRWIQPDPTGTSLDTTRSVLVSVQTAVADDDQVVLAGSTTDLTHGVRQVATVWTRPDGTHWERIKLPGARKRSEALSLSCQPDHQNRTSCLIAGTVDGHLAAWTLSGTQAQGVTGLPQRAIRRDGPRPVAITGTGIRAVAYDSGSRAAVLLESAGHWTETDGPPGHLVAAAGRGGRLYAVTEAGRHRTLFRATPRTN